MKAYVFVGTPELVRSGRPFCYADNKRVIAEGEPEITLAAHVVRFKSVRRARKWKVGRDEEYLVHAWVEVT